MPEITVGNALTVMFLVAVHPVGNVYMIATEPGLTPVTTPVPVTTVAIDVLLLLQVPPPVPSLKCVVCPTQTVVVPMIDPGKLLTVTIVVVEHPETME